MWVGAMWVGAICVGAMWVGHVGGCHVGGLARWVESYIFFYPLANACFLNITQLPRK